MEAVGVRPFKCPKGYLDEARSRDMSMKPSLTFSMLHDTESSLKFIWMRRDCYTGGNAMKGG
jgi:hypothetical protein